jgi:hypothetical protein
MEHYNKAHLCRLDEPNAAGWKTVLLEYAITPIQQYSYTVWKELVRFSDDY